MVDFTARLSCGCCRESFLVHLNGMRAGSRVTCPLCGSGYGISEDEAIRAQRTLDRLESLARQGFSEQGKKLTIRM